MRQVAVGPAKVGGDRFFLRSGQSGNGRECLLPGNLLAFYRKTR